MPDIRSPAKLTQGRFRTNLVANGAWFVFHVGVGIWLTPYLIHHLGVAAYGLVPLAMSLSSYMSVMVVALSGSIGRYVTIALAREDREEANRHFNTALFGSLGLAGMLLPIAAAISFLAPSLINVPPGEENGARVLLLATMVAFLVTTVGSAFAVASYARSRFDVRSGVDAAALSLRVGLIVVLFGWLAPRLWHVGVAVLLGNMVFLAGHYWAWRRLTPELHVTRSSFDRTSLWELLSTGGWLVVNRVGSLLFLNVELLLVNILVGAAAAGSYAPILLWSQMLRSFVGVVAGILAPTIVRLHAEDDQGGLVWTSRTAVKLVGIALALPVGALCGLARPLLHTWLGPEFEQFAPLVWLIIGPLCVNLSITSLFAVQTAANQVRAPGLVSVITGAASVLLAIILVRTTGWGMYGVATASAIMLTLRNGCYTPWYAARILRRPMRVFLAPLTWALVAGAGVALAGLALASAFGLYSWLQLLAAGAVLAIPYAALAFFVIMTASERRTVVRIALGRR